jgi:hypothetical protein
MVASGTTAVDFSTITNLVPLGFAEATRSKVDAISGIM